MLQKLNDPIKYGMVGFRARHFGKAAQEGKEREKEKEREREEENPSVGWRARRKEKKIAASNEIINCSLMAFSSKFFF